MNIRLDTSSLEWNNDLFSNTKQSIEFFYYNSISHVYPSSLNMHDLDMYIYYLYKLLLNMIKT